VSVIAGRLGADVKHDVIIIIGISLDRYILTACKEIHWDAAAAYDYVLYVQRLLREEEKREASWGFHGVFMSLLPGWSSESSWDIPSIITQLCPDSRPR
jgi:hypothetical protein